jgi:hypothetical protein
MSSETLSSHDDSPVATGNTDKSAPHAQGDDVIITVNNEPVEIHRGRQSVVEIKTLGHVPLADQLTELVDGKLIVLPDDGAMMIKGHEVFVSHPKDSGSSSSHESDDSRGEWHDGIS